MSSLPSIPNFFNAWCLHHGDPLALAAALNLTPFQILRLSANAEFIEMTLAWQALQLAHLESRARSLRVIAGNKLCDALHASSDPVELRKGATTLARIANTLIHGPTRRTSRAPLQNGDSHDRAPAATVLNTCGGVTPQDCPSSVGDVPPHKSAALGKSPDRPDTFQPEVSPPHPTHPPHNSDPPHTSPPAANSTLPTRADLLRRLVNAATLPAEIPPVVSLPPHPASIPSPTATLIKRAGVLPRPAAHARDAPRWLAPNPLKRVMSHLLEVPQVG